MDKSSVRIQRYDSLVRSERYFTATLLPAVLFHDNLSGIQRFVELIDGKATTERNKSGEVQPKGLVEYDYEDVEVITEFHIGRDLTFAGALLEVEEGEKRDAPDVVIVAGQEMIVCEGKFFSDFGRLDLNEQLQSQRRQVRHLFHHRPGLRAYRHVAILPFVPEGSIDADAVLTWDDIRTLAEEILGPDHYVTDRLRHAVETYNHQAAADPGVRNYDEKLPFGKMSEKCQDLKNAIWVGHQGGEANLRRCTAAEVARKEWKCRGQENRGSIRASNWIPGDRWLDIVGSLTQSAINSQIPIEPRVRNYDEMLPFEQMRQKCKDLGDMIWVGHEGGEASLRRCTAAYIAAKKWRYRNQNNAGSIIASNWLPGKRWLEIVDGLTQNSIGPASV